MRLRIAATLTYRYAEEANQAYVQARLTPAATARQMVLSHPLSFEPTGWQLAYDEYWGTRVVEVEVADPHRRFSVSVLSDVNLTGLGTAARAKDFSRLDSPGLADSFAEFLQSAPLTTLTGEQARRALDVREAAATPAELVERLTRELASDVKGDERTHRVIAALRVVGVPARFISGYRAPMGDFEPGAAAEGSLTSWLDYWDGAWQGWDPEAVRRIGDRHVIIGWGRDRSDAPPVRGIYAGTHEAECSVEVQVTRLS